MRNGEWGMRNSGGVWGCTRMISEGMGRLCFWEADLMNSFKVESY